MQQGSSDAQLMRGSLRLDVARFVNEGVLIWHDTLAVVPGAAQHLTGADDEVGVASCWHVVLPSQHKPAPPRQTG